MGAILGFITSGLNSFFQGWFNGGQDLLPGSSFHAITAAFATQGYWAQAGFIYFINETGFQSFAILIYLCALIAGVVGMALGAPPKQYLWYFMGPALFHFLLGSTQPVYGTAWKVGGTVDYQYEVWKLAETGLKSSRIAAIETIDVNAYEGPSAPVNVSWFFAQFDGVVSATVETFINWLGVNLLTGDSESNSTTITPPSAEGYNSGGRWHLISNLKWGYLDTIASARLSSPEMRDGFINFMAGDCGDVFQDTIDPARYMSASKSEAGVIPAGIFATTNKMSAKEYAADNRETTTYGNLDSTLGETRMPMPIAFKRLFPKTSMQITDPTKVPDPSEEGSLEWTLRQTGAAFPSIGDNNTPAGLADLRAVMKRGEIYCRTYLDILVRGFRWESANLFVNLEKQLPPGVKDTKNVLEYAMLYGWDIQKFKVEELFGETGSLNVGEISEDKRGEDVKIEERRQYLINLIFINMMKNEFLLAPNAATKLVRLTSAEQSSNAIEMYQKTVGSRNKFGEIYSWARMMPYLQGLLLYILALGYPFACVMILLPRCSKILFTWGSFWIWAKLWDLGFAIVVILERSVWATIGNSSKATQMNPFIVQMSSWGKTEIGATMASNLLPQITFIDHVSSVSPGPYASYRFLDRAMTLFSNMDLDLQNSFYIYIMAALYFAVPAVTGQLVLGGKASIASLVTGAAQNMAQEVGARAGRAFSQQLSRQTEAANQAVDQTLYAKNLEKGGLMARALAAQNNAARADLYRSAMSTNAEGLGNQSQMISQALGARRADSTYGFGYATQLVSSPGNTAMALATLGVNDRTQWAKSLIDQANKMNGAPLNGAPMNGAPVNGAAVNGGSIVGGAMNGATVNGGTMNGGAMNGGAVTGNYSVNPAGVMTGSGGSVSMNGAPMNFNGQSQGHGYDTGGSIGGFASGALNGAPMNGAPLNGGPKEVINQFTGAIMNGAGTAIDMAGKFNNYQIERQGYDIQAGITAQRGDISIASFEANGMSQQYSREAQFLTNEAKGTAQDSAWFEKNAYAQQMAADLGGLDITLPQIGQKSTDDSYLARSGLAGSAAQVESYFFSNQKPDQNKMVGSQADFNRNSYGSLLSGYQADLNNLFGSSQLGELYSSRVKGALYELGSGIEGFSSHVGAQLATIQGMATKAATGQIPATDAITGVVAGSLTFGSGGTSSGTTQGPRRNAYYPGAKLPSDVAQKKVEKKI